VLVLVTVVDVGENSVVATDVGVVQFAGGRMLHVQFAGIFVQFCEEK
jgi:hypothetical protein